METYPPPNDTHVPSNKAEHQQAVADAKLWVDGNNTALACIVAAVPADQFHLVEHMTYAKQAWENLRSVSRPHNSLCAATIKSQIMAYCRTADMDNSGFRLKTKSMWEVTGR
jgi:hypothetical protein